MQNLWLFKVIIRRCVALSLNLSDLELYFKNKAYCVCALVYLILSLSRLSLVYLSRQLDAEQFHLYGPVTLLCISISPIYSKPTPSGLTASNLVYNILLFSKCRIKETHYFASVYWPSFTPCSSLSMHSNYGGSKSQCLLVTEKNSVKQM